MNAASPPSPRSAWPAVQRKDTHVQMKYCNSRPTPPAISSALGYGGEQGNEWEYLVEVLAKDVPFVRPLETDPVHGVVRDLDQLLQTEELWMLGEAGGLNLLP